MTSIQIITFGKEKQSRYNGIDVQISSFIEYMAFDDFEINIIDTSSKSFWEGWLEMCLSRGGIYQPFVGSSYAYIQESNMKQICDVIENCKSTIIFVAPLNLDVKFEGRTHKLSAFNETVGDLFGGFILRGMAIELMVEKTTTKIDKLQYNAPLHLPHHTPINQSERSKKTTTAKIYGKKYVTTLDIFESAGHFQTFVSQFLKNKETTPDWFDELQYFDDEMQKNTITANEETILKANEKIEAARIKMKNNNRFKSILYTNGNELVDVVHEILGELIGVDLSSFIDERKEDFCISKNGTTFLGEIKGTNSNISNSNISQLTNHCDLYEEKCKENGEIVEIRRLLIMNHQRNKALVERQHVHCNQIVKAERDGCLIIETPVLLKLYESFKNGERSSDDCLRLFTDNTGLLVL